jgi:hypothetical protein
MSSIERVVFALIFGVGAILFFVLGFKKKEPVVIIFGLVCSAVALIALIVSNYHRIRRTLEMHEKTMIVLTLLFSFGVVLFLGILLNLLVFTIMGSVGLITTSVVVLARYYHRIRIWSYRALGIKTVRVQDAEIPVWWIREVRRVTETEIYVYTHDYTYATQIHVSDDDDARDVLNRFREAGLVVIENEKQIRRARVKALLDEIREAATIPKFVRGVYLRHIDSLNAESAILKRLESIKDEEVAFDHV